jgi:hypothetical protein
MRQRILCWTLILISLAGTMSVGCHKRHSIERSERIQESEPQMVSPGHEKLE